MNLLLRNATAILTGLQGPAARATGPDLRVRDGRIAAIGTLTPEPGERQIDATGCAIYPAWVNTHHHLFQSLLKGDPVGLNATLSPWLLATPMRLRPLRQGAERGSAGSCRDALWTMHCPGPAVSHAGRP